MVGKGEKYKYCIQKSIYLVSLIAVHLVISLSQKGGLLYSSFAFEIKLNVIMRCYNVPS